MSLTVNLKVLINGYDITYYFDDTLHKMKELQEAQRSIINESVMICKLLLLNRVSIAAEGLFRPLEG